MRNQLSALAASMPLALAIFTVAVPVSASAQTAPNSCVAGKLGCVAKEAAAFVKCQAKAQKSGTPISEECLAKAREKFLGAPDVAGCFAKLEAKQNVEKPSSVCRTENDAALTDALNDALSEAMTCGRDPLSCGGGCAHSPCAEGASLSACSPCVEKVCSQPFLADCCTSAWDAACVVGASELCNVNCDAAPATGPNSCSSGKSLCLAQKVKGLLGCYKKAEAKGVSVDAACLQKVEDKFDGGSDPSQGCFAKLEAKQNVDKPASVCPVESDDSVAFSDYAVDRLACDLDSDACPCCNDRCVDVVDGAPATNVDRSVFTVCGDTCKMKTEFSSQCGTCTGCEFGEICVDGECRCEVGEPRCQEIAPVPNCINVSASTGMPSCGFLKNPSSVTEPPVGTAGPGTHGNWIDHFLEVETWENTPVWIYLNGKELEPVLGNDYTPIVFSCDASNGAFRAPNDEFQRDYFQTDGTITDEPGLLAHTPQTLACTTFVAGPTYRGLPPIDPFANLDLKGYYLLFTPDPGESGKNYNTISILMDDSSSRTAMMGFLPFHVWWITIHVNPGPPPA